jgi:hypothetical protein
MQEECSQRLLSPELQYSYADTINIALPYTQYYTNLVKALDMQGLRFKTTNILVNRS